MFLLPANYFACAIVIDTYGAEQRFWISRTKRCKFFQVSMQLFSNILKIEHSIDIECCFDLFRFDMAFDIFLESFSEFPLHLPIS